MAFAVFDLRIQFGGGFAVFGQIKIRVVTETVLPERRVVPLSVPYALGDNRARVVLMTEKNQYADIRTTFVGLAGKFGGKFQVVGGIGFGIAAGVTCGMDARRAV